jgi:hypothetical protein
MRKHIRTTLEWYWYVEAWVLISAQQPAPPSKTYAARLVLAIGEIDS